MEVEYADSDEENEFKQFEVNKSENSDSFVEVKVDSEIAKNY